MRNLWLLSLLWLTLVEQRLLAPQIQLPHYLVDSLTRLKLEARAIADLISQTEQALVQQKLAGQEILSASLRTDLTELLAMQAKNLHDAREIENSRITAPATSGCNSPHDCAEGANCDYANGACKACARIGNMCDPTRSSYSECCKNLSCDHTGRCVKVVA